MASCLLAPTEAASELCSLTLHSQTGYSASTILQRIFVMTQLQLRKAGAASACNLTCCMHGPKYLPPLHLMRCARACDCAWRSCAHPQLRRLQSQLAVKEAHTLCAAEVPVKVYPC